MRLDYLIPLRDHVMRPLVKNGQDMDAAKECAEIIKEYGLSREDASISLTEFGLVASPSAKAFERLPSKADIGSTFSDSPPSSFCRALMLSPPFPIRVDTMLFGA